ncbi:MAG: MarR family transcriptional regulator [Deltaproteobacteria bacterium]|nr:MarR family transcriptional regulator [Deltaproteobacteria bacterium]
MRCAKWVDTIYNRALKTEGMTVTQYETLLSLVEAGPLRQVDIVECLGSDKGSVPRILERLEREGMAKRVRNKDDARSMVVEITPEGKRKMVHVLEKIRKVTRDLTQELSESDFDAFESGLNKVVKAAREIRQ